MRVAMPKVNREALADCLMWFPGYVEQAAILNFVDRASAPINRVIARLEREIELLREYRTRLVADVVTGKVDVRDAARRVPEARQSGLIVDGSDVSDDIDFADEEAVA